MDHLSKRFLIVEAGTLQCALPLSLVREVMRALPIKPLRDVPPGVLGASIVRGLPLPVVSLPHLLHQSEAEVTRFVVVRTPGRDCVLAVSRVKSIAAFDSDAWQRMPKLLRSVDSVEQIAAADEDLIVTLDAARVLDIAHLPQELRG